jgi:hypothetical protein
MPFQIESGNEDSLAVYDFVKGENNFLSNLVNSNRSNFLRILRN